MTSDDLTNELKEQAGKDWTKIEGILASEKKAMKLCGRVDLLEKKERMYSLLVHLLYTKHMDYKVPGDSVIKQFNKYLARGATYQVLMFVVFHGLSASMMKADISRTRGKVLRGFLKAKPSSKEPRQKVFYSLLCCALDAAVKSYSSCNLVGDRLMMAPFIAALIEYGSDNPSCLVEASHGLFDGSEGVDGLRTILMKIRSNQALLGESTKCHILLSQTLIENAGERKINKLGELLEAYLHVLNREKSQKRTDICQLTLLVRKGESGGDDGLLQFEEHLAKLKQKSFVREISGKSWCWGTKNPKRVNSFNEMLDEIYARGWREDVFQGLFSKGSYSGHYPIIWITDGEITFFTLLLYMQRVADGRKMQVELGGRDYFADKGSSSEGGTGPTAQNPINIKSMEDFFFRLVPLFHEGQPTARLFSFLDFINMVNLGRYGCYADGTKVFAIAEIIAKRIIVKGSLLTAESIGQRIMDLKLADILPKGRSDIRDIARMPTFLVEFFLRAGENDARLLFFIPLMLESEKQRSIPAAFLAGTMMNAECGVYPFERRFAQVHILNALSGMRPIIDYYMGDSLLEHLARMGEAVKESSQARTDLVGVRTTIRNLHQQIEILRTTSFRIDRQLFPGEKWSMRNMGKDFSPLFTTSGRILVRIVEDGEPMKGNCENVKEWVKNVVARSSKNQKIGNVQVSLSEGATIPGPGEFELMTFHKANHTNNDFLEYMNIALGIFWIKGHHEGYHAVEGMAKAFNDLALETPKVMETAFNFIKSSLHRPSHPETMVVDGVVRAKVDIAQIISMLSEMLYVDSKERVILKSNVILDGGKLYGLEVIDDFKTKVVPFMNKTDVSKHAGLLAVNYNPSSFLDALEQLLRRELSGPELKDKDCKVKEVIVSSLLREECLTIKIVCNNAFPELGKLINRTQNSNTDMDNELGLGGCMVRLARMVNYTTPRVCVPTDNITGEGLFIVRKQQNGSAGTDIIINLPKCNNQKEGW